MQCSAQPISRDFLKERPIANAYFQTRGSGNVAGPAGNS